MIIDKVYSVLIRDDFKYFDMRDLLIHWTMMPWGKCEDFNQIGSSTNCLMGQSLMLLVVVMDDWQIAVSVGKWLKSRRINFFD